ncbi:putative transcriptional regulator YheO [Georgenia soli]|uniref:Putative transcriptional regulator YheO n=1 Tax=Georgenia soli TaxID=638953 RepID=A0A2A9F2C2_9MICO|nr:PAS domain-containing protein [Georgenia soli]PFG44966.1 putative transcriptional regulator YheO [Georgenia soli]
MTQLSDSGALATNDQFDDIETLYAVLHPVMRAIAAAVGRHCEVVLHDLRSRSMDRTIYAIENGHVTGRTVGGPSTNLGLGVLQNEGANHDAFGYRGRTSDGRDLHCSSVYYRDRSGAVIAALCINIDLTPLKNAEALVASLIPTAADAQSPEEIVGPDIQHVLEDMIESAVEAVGKPVNLMDKRDRVEVLRLLEERGAFHIKRSVDRVAARLGISKVTAYSDLDTVRNGRA